MARLWKQTHAHETTHDQLARAPTASRRSGGLGHGVAKVGGRPFSSRLGRANEDSVLPGRVDDVLLQRQCSGAKVSMRQVGARLVRRAEGVVRILSALARRKAGEGRRALHEVRGAEWVLTFIYP